MGGAPLTAAGVAVAVVGIWLTVALAARKAVRGEIEAAPPAREPRTDAREQAGAG
jgi:hypothetical protein